MTPRPDEDGAWVDLHLHSSCSDGADPPEQVVARARAFEISAIALTDHDTIAGVERARNAAEAIGLGFLPGVEISAEFKGREIHVVGLGVDVASPVLGDLLHVLSEMRRRRLTAILDALQRMNLSLDVEQVLDSNIHVQPGRMHVAKALRHMGAATSVQNAFDRYLNPGCPAHVPKQLPPAEEVIAATHQARGLAFLAHPGLGRWSPGRVNALLALPFDGIEAWHVSHTPDMVRQFSAMAGKRSLLVAGGSDCHGGIKGEAPTMGRVKVPHDCYATIVKRLKECFSES